MSAERSLAVALAAVEAAPPGPSPTGLGRSVVRQGSKVWLAVGDARGTLALLFERPIHPVTGAPLTTTPVAAYLGWHRPAEDAADPAAGGCLFYPSCAHDGSAVDAVPLGALLRSHGGDALWNELEDRHARRFGGWDRVVPARARFEAWARAEWTGAPPDAAWLGFRGGLAVAAALVRAFPAACRDGNLDPEALLRALGEEP